MGEERRKLREALQAMVDHEVEYMTINNLGDPEKQHNVIRARHALAAEPASGEEELDAAIAYFEANWSGYTETQRRWFIVLIKAATNPFGPPQDGVDAADIEFALRKRADEATKAENEACAHIARLSPGVAAAIRARIAPLKERALWAADQQNS